MVKKKNVTPKKRTPTGFFGQLREGVPEAFGRKKKKKKKSPTLTIVIKRENGGRGGFPFSGFP